MIITEPKLKRIIAVRLNPGEDILLSLRKAVAERNIRSAIILGGFGSVSKYHFHVVTSADLPPDEAYPKEDVACDILTLSGLIIDGRVHAHITLSTDEMALGGHLEEGNPALTFTVVYLAETEDVSYTDWDQIKDF